MNHRCTDYIKIEGEEVHDVESFVYLGSVLDRLGGAEAEIKRQLAFTRLKYIWRSGRGSQKAKLRNLNSNVLSVLLYGAEIWKMTTTDLSTCPRKVLRRFWPNQACEEPVAI